MPILSGILPGPPGRLHHVIVFCSVALLTACTADAITAPLPESNPVTEEIRAGLTIVNQDARDRVLPSLSDQQIAEQLRSELDRAAAAISRLDGRVALAAYADAKRILDIVARNPADAADAMAIERGIDYAVSLLAL